MADLTEFHDELRAVAREVLAKPGPVDIAATGWCGLEVPSELDGAGATFAEVAVILTELGRAAAQTSYLGSAVLGVGALLLLEQDALLRGIANGTTAVAVALEGTFRIEGSRLYGQASFVPDAAEAQHLLVITDEGTAVVSDGLTVAPQPVLDQTRRLATVHADGVTIDETARFADHHQTLRNRAAIAIACDSLGISEAMLDATVAYVATREQFGRPVGSFQAVKHACADMLVKTTMSRTLIAEAIRNPTSVTASQAKSYVCAAAVDVAGTAMQLHGGIGYTWESGIHRYLKRATLNRSLFGSPAAHRRLLAQRYA
ncbi:acyl-CoA dehydrogenase family protein [Cryptosporangium sp. NPDC048952]|uniref:acyl-CoA dehydrogenase family protein n=1 Tax=Cryptosporangium sp. NPDC048952 TaxID=3363961 RepID=UPI00371C1905